MLIKPQSSVSRVVDENGEPKIKMYSAMARHYEDEAIKDLILGVEVVNEDLLDDGFYTEMFPEKIMGSPQIKATKNNETIFVGVLTSRYPQSESRIKDTFKTELIKEYNGCLYMAEVGLWYVGDEETGEPSFFVNYRGLKRLFLEL